MKQTTPTIDNIPRPNVSEGNHSLRICMMSATFPPDICGVGDNASHLTHFLEHMGMRVSVYTSRGASASSENGLDVRREFARWNIGMVFRMIREIRTAAYDVIHIQYTPQMYGSRMFAVSLLPLFVRMLTGRPVLVTFHEIYTPFIDDLKQNVLIFLNRIKDTFMLLGCSDAIVSVPRRAERLSGLFPWKRSRIHVIPIGPNIIPELCSPGEPGDEAVAQKQQRERFGILDDGLILSSFGMLHMDKRYDLLFSYVRRLIDSGERVYLMLIGPYSDDHPYYIYLKKCIDDLDLTPYIIWTGSGTSSEVSTWLSMTDIYVMTDIRGASARKSSLLSALSHGLPVVSNRGDDTTDTFVNDENIVLVPEADDEGFVSSLSRLLQNPEERRRIGVNARKLYESSYAWEILAERNIELYTHYVPRV